MSYEVAQPALCSAGSTPVARATSGRRVPPRGALVRPPRAAGRIIRNERGK